MPSQESALHAELTRVTAERDRLLEFARSMARLPVQELGHNVSHVTRAKAVIATIPAPARCVSNDGEHWTPVRRGTSGPRCCAWCHRLHPDD